MTKSPLNVTLERHRPSIFATILLYFCFLFFFVLFIGLGIWQVERLHWKLNLIAQVDARVHLPPVPAPIDPKQWKHLAFDQNEYQQVELKGTYLNDKETLVTAVADQGAGYWLMTPMRTENGHIVYINRGFVPMDDAVQARRQAGLVHGPTLVRGLLRMSESNGILFRKNKPMEKIWYSREIPLIAQSSGLALDQVAPYFIDADATPIAGGVPQGGLTVIHFRNAHLSYAITWFFLAGMVFFAAGYVTYWRQKNSH